MRYENNIATAELQVCCSDI